MGNRWVLPPRHMVGEAVGGAPSCHAPVLQGTQGHKMVRIEQCQGQPARLSPPGYWSDMPHASSLQAAANLRHQPSQRKQNQLQCEDHPLIF